MSDFQLVGMPFGMNTVCFLVVGSVYTNACVPELDVVVFVLPR